MFNDIFIFMILFMIGTSASLMGLIYVREIYLGTKKGKKHIF